MAAIPPKTYITVDEYLAAEEISELKHEYYDGELLPRLGISESHCIICGNLISLLYRQTRKRDCRIYTSGMMVKVSNNHYVYSDLAAVYGQSFFEQVDQKILLNPNLIVEVLSPSTEGYDRGTKFENYRSIPSFQEYILIAQDRIYLEHHVRQPESSWLLTEYTQLTDKIQLPSIDCTLSLADIYEKVDLPVDE